MASTDQSGDREDRKDGEEGRKEAEEGLEMGEEEEQNSVQGIQSRYLRCPSPSFSMASMESRFSAITGSDAASIFMEPIHLSSAIAAKKIINEELPPRGVRAESIPESMLESAEQLMVEDLYNRVQDMIDDRSPYNTPCVLDIQRAMVQERLEAPANPVDEVWPNIFIAEKSVAVNKARLKRMGVTHVLNAAHGTGVYTGESFYSGMNITYMGIEVDDFANADIATHFRPTAEFLDEALLTHKGKVLVVSMMGASRSAVLVASYLMIFHNMSIMEALTSIRKKRPINPNEGFLKQLRELNETLMEERDDDDDTISQCSVVDARARARIFGEEEEGEEEEENREDDDEGSLVEVKARSIMMEEEEDGQSVMSSVASSSAVLMAVQNGVEREEEVRVKLKGEEEEQDEEDELGSMMREWQRRNEKYQSDDWWEAQLNSDEEEGGGVGGGAESVTSEDVRVMRERVKRRQRRPPADTASTATSCSTYADLWRQRLREIEEQAAARYARREDDGDEEEEGDEDGGSEGGESAALVAGRGRRRKVEEEAESILSDSSSMYNFCQRNKEKMTPLERWRVKRIQFGWNKKDREDDGEGSDVTTAAPATPSLQDVNLTAYQSWKLRQQRRYGGEEDRQEVLELSRGEDSASVRRKQRREEVLERARKTLEESRSVCGWDEQSTVSGATVPLSAFWAGVGVAGPTTATEDDARSVMSGRLSNISSVSQSRGQRSVANAPALPLPTPPPIPVPTVTGPGGEPLVNLASIQNWITNVVTETIKQKQSEMSSCGSSASSVLSGRFADDDRASLLSSTSHTSVLSQGRGQSRGPASSVLSGVPSSVSRGSALSSHLSSAPSSSIIGGRRKKITTTSVPLFSLFQDEVDMGKLDAMDKEIKSEMRGRMDAYEKKKILEDNRRSTLYKKKKPRGDGEEEDEEEEDERKRREEEFLKETKKKEKPRRSHGLSGCLNLNPELERDKDTSVDDWLRSVRPPQRRPAPLDDQLDDPYDDLDASASEFDFSSRRESFCLDEEEEEKYGGTSRYRSRLLLDGEGEVFPSNGISQQQRPYGVYEAAELRGRKPQEEEDDDDDVAAFIAQTRQRARARAAAMAEAEGDEVLTAWRAQQDAKSQGRSAL